MGNEPSLTGTAVPVALTGGPDVSALPIHGFDEAQERYTTERAKRLRPDGLDQYIDVSQTHQFRHLQEDVWADHAALNAQETPVKDGDRSKILILGAGYTGLLLAARLQEAGIDGADIRLAESAGGFGGTWYWNRYPGLMCDVESYIYMPLLEELGYMPKHKYSHGPELRQHANNIADKYGLRDRTAFRMDTKSMDWNNDDKTWRVLFREGRGPENDPRDVTVHANFVLLATGGLVYSQIPKLEGLESFEPHVFHTTRWDYKYTGGSPEVPDLSNLRGKRVGIIGTGATAVQVVPHLAKWAKQTYVFQRTPASVDVRDNRTTDPELWQTDIAKIPGWQAERRWNFLRQYANTEPRPLADMVNDAITRSPSLSAMMGAPGKGVLAPEQIGALTNSLLSTDLPRQQRLHRRVDDVVKDQATAEKLKAWYPTWCKRPIFHDEYLPAFNNDNVTLVDTDGKGVDRLTETGVIAGGNEYEVDCLIFSTGFRAPFAKGPAGKSNIVVRGRDGVDLEEKWTQGVATLHGVCSNGFPNFFYPGIAQAALEANYMHSMEHSVRQIVHIIVETNKSLNDVQPVVIENTVAAEEAWTQQILAHAAAFAPGMNCTPSYYNNEGENFKAAGLEEQMKKARGAPYGDGVESYVRVLEEWRRDGKMEGLVVS